MSNSQIPQAGEEAGSSQEVASYFGADENQPAEKPDQGEANSEETEDKKISTTDDDESKDTKSKSSEDEASEEEAEKEEEETSSEDKDDEDEDAEDDQKFEVAGKEYDNIDDAIKAVNRISGDNTRLAGDVNTLTKQNEGLTTQLDESSKSNQTLVSVVKQWEDYYDSGEDGDKPKKSDAKDLKDVVAEELDKREQKKSESARKKTQKSESEALVDEPDFKEVYPRMKEMMEKFDKNELSKIGPKGFYDMVRGMLVNEGTLLPQKESIRKKDSSVNSKVIKKKVSKIIGGNKQVSAQTQPEDVSPEVASYFN